MVSSWPLVKLGEFVDIQTGHPFKSKSYSEVDGIKLLRGDNIVQGHFRWENVKLWPEELIGAKEKAYFLDEGDVILAMDRPWIEAGLKTAQLNKSDLPCLLVQRVARLRTKEADDQDFLRYLVSSYWFVQYVKLVQTGTAVPHISSKQIKDFEFNLPPAETRKKIGYLMKTLDSKIHLNRQTNQTLEQMAQALFKSWFVDFDPVIDNALAAGNVIPDELQARAELRKSVQQMPDVKPLPESIRQLFPNEFEESELGWIPKGWEVKNLSELLEVKYGKDHKKLDDGKFPVYGSGGLMRSVNDFLFEGESVLIPRKGTLSNIMYVNETFWTVDTMFFTIPKVPNIAKFSFYFLKKLDFNNMNVGSAVPSMTTKVLNALKLVCPTKSVLDKFDETLEMYFSKSTAGKENTEQLEKLRDTLLPKLISGNIKLANQNSKKD